MGALAVLTCLFASTSSAQDVSVDAALAALEEGFFDQADEILDEVVADPDVSRHDLARAHLYRGLLEATEGHNEESRLAFELAVALEAQIEPPAIMGRSARERLEEVRASRDGAELTLSVAVEGSMARVSTAFAPPALIGSVRVFTDGGFEQTLEPPGPWTVQLPEEVVEGAAVLRAELSTSAGTVIATAAADIEPLGPLQPPAGQGDREPDDDGIFASPWLWTIVGAVVIGTAVGVTLWATAEPEHELVTNVPWR